MEIKRIKCMEHRLGKSCHIRQGLSQNLHRFRRRNAQRPRTRGRQRHRNHAVPIVRVGHHDLHGARRQQRRRNHHHANREREQRQLRDPDNAGTALTDADTNTTGFQVDLSEGANIINVEVTAEDASTETYTVTVTRTPADCETDDIWCATLTVGTHTAGGLTFYGYSVGLGDTTGTLSPNTFTYRAATIGVLALKYDSGATGTLRWGISLLSGTTPTDGVLGDDDFTLHVGTHTFAIDAPGTTTTFTFPDHGLSWTVGDTVTVRLVKNPSSDVTLSTLVVNDGTDDLSPDPAFDPATLGYSVEVDHDVDEVTVTPTLNDTSASYEIQDDEGAALTDVDTTQDDFQVSISPGPNTINVVITGADGHTTQTYTVTVQRINILVSNIDQATAVATSVGNNGSAQIKHAQKFTTGSNTSGYTLYDVKLFLDSSASSEPIVTVNTADGNNPGTLLYNLTAKDSSLTLDGPRRFTANAGATLDASTSYFIVAANGNTTNSTQARYNLYLTDSNAEDSTGLSDWSITNSGRTGNPNWSGTSGNRAFNIQVRGTVTPASTRRDPERPGPAGRVGRLRPHARPRVRLSDTGIWRHSWPRRWRDNHHPDPERHGRRLRGPRRRRHRPHGRRYHPGRVPGLHRPWPERHPG